MSLRSRLWMRLAKFAYARAGERINPVGEPAHGGSRPNLPEPVTVEGWQEHLVAHHEFERHDRILLPGCEFCGGAVERPDQPCPKRHEVGGGTCAWDAADLEALHDDVHSDERMDGDERHVHS